MSQDFFWGAATSSYQIEGAVREDGRGECIWTRFAHTPGKTHNGDTGDVACDHYHRYREDIELMRALGLRAYRFSISWPRILPTGAGTVNPAGLDFYDRLVDELLAAGIQPFATLYHWDLPQTLQDHGGWAHPDSVDWFSDYAGVVSQHLGDRVRHWVTHNEPWVTAFLGYWLGIHAPGLQDLPTAYRVAHHLLLSHGAAVPIIRQNTAEGVQVGITLDLVYDEPASERDEDVAAARREDGFKNRWFLDPVFKGHHPADMVDWLGETLDGIALEDVKAAAVPLDFLGINYYTRHRFAAGDSGPMKTRQDGHFTAMDWEVYPDGLTKLLTRVHREYEPAALYVTENGAAYTDPPPQDGVVHDPDRTAYLHAHLDAAGAAIDAGVPLKGYFVWSLLDNFEWAEGYDKRFGIIHVDFATQERTMKSSALAYRDRIRQHE